MQHVYKSDKLKYPLSNKEYDDIDKVWEFINRFNQKYTFLSDYRENIIKEISYNYSVNEFYRYESIASKLVWNLKTIMDSINKISTGCSHKKFSSDEEKDAIINIFLKNNTYYRSGINKAVIVDSRHHKIITRPTEGSSNILSSNKNNAQIGKIFQKRKKYEKIMSDPYNYNYDKIKIPEFYYEFDYAYPNLNLSVYKVDSKINQIKRIKDMYFIENCERNWFRIL